MFYVCREKAIDTSDHPVPLVLALVCGELLLYQESWPLDPSTEEVPVLAGALHTLKPSGSVKKASPKQENTQSRKREFIQHRRLGQR